MKILSNNLIEKFKKYVSFTGSNIMITFFNINNDNKDYYNTLDLVSKLDKFYLKYQFYHENKPFIYLVKVNKTDSNSFYCSFLKQYETSK